MIDFGMKAEIAKKLRAKRAEQEAEYSLEKNESAAGDRTLSYYDSGRKTFWVQNSRSQWIEYTEGSLKRLLRFHGLGDRCEKGENLSIVEEKLVRIQMENDVAFAGQLAGYEKGIHTVCGQRILCTHGPVLIKPVKGEWDTLKFFLQGLLKEEFTYFAAWLKSAFAALKAGPSFRPGQVLVVAGPPGCGKSLLQNLITEMLGGRSAKPYRYMTGKTDFNSDLFNAEHLMIEDEAASTDIRSRREFGANVKNMLVNEVQSYHPKGRPAFPLHPFWRISISLNCEPEDLLVLPPIDEGLKDKFIILKANEVDFPYSDEDAGARKIFREYLTAELPAFLFWLKEWRLPKALTDRRYGVKSYQSKEILQALENLSPEMQLLEIIDKVYIWEINNTEWHGTAFELQQRIAERDKTGQSRSLFGYNSACGTYLARLAKKKRDRILEKSRKGGAVVWTIIRERD